MLAAIRIADSHVHQPPGVAAFECERHIQNTSVSSIPLIHHSGQADEDHRLALHQAKEYVCAAAPDCNARPHAPNPNYALLSLPELLPGTCHLPTHGHE
jgi:hypothetical protein